MERFATGFDDLPELVLGTATLADTVTAVAAAVALWVVVSVRRGGHRRPVAGADPRVDVESIS